MFREYFRNTFRFEFHSSEEVLQLVRQRWEGIRLLRQMLGDQVIDFQPNGGHELFPESKEDRYAHCLGKMKSVNQLLEPVFGPKTFKTSANRFNFKKVKEQYITHTKEGQVDTGKMMSALLQLTAMKEIRILNAISVQAFQESGDRVHISTNQFDFTSKKLFIATNGFASQLLEEQVQPARAQVLITKPIENLHIKGTFHLDEGYYYFRNIDDRILFGGGRNLDFKREETFTHGATRLVQDQLEKILREIILPNTSFQIDYTWSGIMGVGKTKKPIVKQISNHAYCGVRLSGMGVAIGSHIGRRLAELSF